MRTVVSHRRDLDRLECMRRVQAIGELKSDQLREPKRVSCSQSRQISKSFLSFRIPCASIWEENKRKTSCMTFDLNAKKCCWRLTSKRSAYLEWELLECWLRWRILEACFTRVRRKNSLSAGFQLGQAVVFRGAAVLIKVHDSFQTDRVSKWIFLLPLSLARRVLHFLHLIWAPLVKQLKWLKFQMEIIVWNQTEPNPESISDK